MALLFRGSGRKKTSTVIFFAALLYLFYCFLLVSKQPSPSEDDTTGNRDAATESVRSLQICTTRLDEFDGPLHARINDLFNATNIVSDTVLNENPDLKPGGSWRPTNCIAQSKLALIIPFRDRDYHLYKLLSILFQVLKRQQLDFRIILAEQHGTGPFNKGRIMNAAFEYAQKLDVDCVVFHDVDVLPEDDRIPYGCPKLPRHLGGRVSTLDYKVWFDYMTGGAFAISMDHYIKANGYSNEFWGWGGEDDDFGRRLKASGLKIIRPDAVIGKYTMLTHVKRTWMSHGQTDRLLWQGAKRFRTDGLCCNKNWTIVSDEAKPLFRHIYIDVGEMNSQWKEVFKMAAERGATTTVLVEK
uniref:Beta-1,4-N-acetylgalactosaminyltransferase n=1 Tax=Plectus sambesii TaxID=2011161 RepID=A0A914WE52_9BILA